MFEKFDFTMLDDPDFKEDSVREELLVPIITNLGYAASGNAKVIRSKSLVHPYVAIGSKRQKIYIIPDYMFLSGDECLWILDAKSPREQIDKGKHVEQAYSYAIHPEVRAQYYALCNGREFILWDIRKFEPIMHFYLEDIFNHWNGFNRILNPRIKANPALLDYHPDYGIFLRHLGVVDNCKHVALAVRSRAIAKVADDQYTTMTIIPGDVDCAMSLYFDKRRYEQFLRLQPPHLQAIVEEGLSHMPYIVVLEDDDEFLFGVDSTMYHAVQDNNEESYIPFVVDRFLEYIEL